MLGIYVHVPFCMRKCFYCAFDSLPKTKWNENFIEEYINCVCCEIERTSYTKSVDTIFFGGGTPSILSPKQIERIISKIDDKFGIMLNSEISMECNPFTVKGNLLSDFKNAGINRISIGGQSFDDFLLKKIGRLHSSFELSKTIEIACSLGFDSVGVDLIFGFPNYTKDILSSDIDKVLKFPIEHISLYMFMAEEGTLLGDKCINGDLEIPNDDLLVEQMEYAHGQLVKNGFCHYEISNFAKNNKFCRHNLKYWNFEEYLGFGSSACSFVNGERFKNISDPFQYCKNIVNSENIQEYTEKLPLKNSEGEFVMLKLRLASGLSCSEFYKIFGEDFEKVYFKELKFLIQNGFIEKKAINNDNFFYIPYKFFSIQSEIAKYFIIL